MYIELIAVVVALLSFGDESFAQTQYNLKVVEDVTLERGSKNFNYLEYLIVGLHPDYPKKRSLLRFENLPNGSSSHTDAEAPFIARTIQAHRVLKSWKETQATSTKRDSSKYWSTQWLGLDNTDAKSISTGVTTIYPGQPKGFVGIGVTSAVKDWKAGYPNYGLVIWATNENIVGRDTRFASKSESDSSKHPYIVVSCFGSTGGGGGGGGNTDAPTLPTDDFHSF
ncbi:uncharacterized protein [Dysidea avara]|uniref:uncharacterized protein n=1 Tax=Dysidea avara TaxID=196820 RepID=UPI00331CAD65